MGTNKEDLKRLPKGEKSSFKKKTEAVGKKQ